MEQLPRRPVLLAQLKKLLPKPDGNDGYDDVLSYVLDKTIMDVANYCHVDPIALSEHLDSTIVAMCMQYVGTHQLLTPLDEQSGDVDSISEGDTSGKFKSPSQAYLELQEANVISDNFLATLNSYRVVKQ